MSDLIGCMVEGNGRRGKVRAVTSDSAGRLYLWVEDEEWGELSSVGGGGTIKILPGWRTRKVPEDVTEGLQPMPLPPGVR